VFFHTYTFYWVLAGICIYAVATRGLFRVTNNWRLSLIDLAAELKESPDFPQDRKGLILRTLDDVHSARAAWHLTFLFLQMIIVLPFVRKPHSTSMTNVPRKLQAAFDLFATRCIIATVSNSVLASLVFVMAAIITAAFSSIQPIGRLLISGRDRAADHHPGHTARA
jgi:hypothetical protein